MEDLKEIGFYTLSNDRTANATELSRLQRAEMILTGRCNFTCKYCRSTGGQDQKQEDAEQCVRTLAKEKLRAIRFSGGEPTLHKGLLSLVKLSKSLGIEKIAVSSNGYSNLDLYLNLIDHGVNDFSISLDACCAEKADEMAGGIKGAFDKITSNIRELSKRTYVTVGVVLTQDNIDSLNDTISFASSLGVADIRIIPAAQESDRLKEVKVLDEMLSKHPILAYRVKNIQDGLPVRGISNNDYNRCGIVLDDVAVVDGYHYPCIISFREGAPPIGKLEGNWRSDRLNWFKNTNTHQNNICKSNCLDCLVKANNLFAITNKKYGGEISQNFDKKYHLPLAK